MGADTATDVGEGIPVVYPETHAPKTVNGYVALPSEGAGYQRRWRHHVLNCFGSCSPEDTAACCLTANVPFVSYGWNASKGLKLSFWTEAGKFLALTAGTWIIFHLLQSLVAFHCGPMPPPHGPMHHHGPMPHHHPAVPGDNSVPVADLMFTPITPEEFAPQHPGPIHDPMHPLPGPPHVVDSPVCNAARPIALTISMVLIIAAWVMYAFYLGRRRTQLKAALGIHPASDGCGGCNDVLLHLCCPACALTQETRTLMHEEAIGTLPGRLVGPVLAAPADAKMDKLAAVV